MVGRSLAEKPKIGELQMDWLRSEDLKEEKNVTAPNCHNSRYGPLVFGVVCGARRNIEDMPRLPIEHPASSARDGFIASDVLLREEPEEEEEEEDDDSKEDEDNNGDGYSE